MTALGNPKKNGFEKTQRDVTQKQGLLYCPCFKVGFRDEKKDYPSVFCNCLRGIYGKPLRSVAVALKIPPKWIGFPRHSYIKLIRFVCSVLNC